MQHGLVYVMPMMHNSLTAPCRRRSAFPLLTGTLIAGDMSHKNDKPQAEQEVLDRTKDEIRKSLLVQIGKIIENERDAEKGEFETLGDSKLLIEKQVVHAIAECAFQQAGLMVKDMFAFARHAKRVNVNQDDVKLLFRRRKDLLLQIQKFEKTKKRKISSSKTTSSEATALASSAKRVRNQFDDDEEDELFF